MKWIQRTATVVLFKWLARPECRAEKKWLPLLIHLTHLGDHRLSGQPLVSSFPGMKAKSARGSHSEQL